VSGVAREFRRHPAVATTLGPPSREDAVTHSAPLRRRDIRICRLLQAAAIRAIVTGRERIDLELLTDDLATSSLVSIADRRMRRPTS
jgi:hypothetical protein